MIYRFAYEGAIRFYSLAARLTSPFLPKADLWVKGRKNWRDRLITGMKGAEGKKRIAWFHSASLGEFEQGRPVIEAFRKEYPDSFIVLTFYSPSGYEIRKKYSGADYICYLPADTYRNARDFVNIVHPDIAFFIKYEFWYNYLNSLREKQIPVVLFAAIFRENQAFFKWWGGTYRSVLSVFRAILVQNDDSRRLLRQVEGVRDVIVAGDTRFDRVLQLVQAGRELPEIESFVGEGPCLVVGSAWEPDMKLIIGVLNQLGGRLKAVIAPHEIDRQQINSWRAALSKPSMLYSEYRETGFPGETGASYLFIDNIGMLSSLYKYGDIAYIGGAFGKGLHNTLEAATYGMPIFFGNKSYTKFSEAIELIEIGVAQAVGNEKELKAGIVRYLQDSSLLKSAGEESRKYVSSRSGATEKVMQVVREIF